MVRHHKRYTILITLAIFLLSHTTLVRAAGEPPIMRSAKGEITALFDGPSCGEKVRTIFQGRNQDDFRTKTGVATRLMTNVTQLVHRQCPQMRQLTSRGVVKGKTVYTGLASSATSWAIKERGTGGTGAAAGAAAEQESDTGAKQKFRDNKDFLSYSAMLTKMQNKTILCTNYVAQSQSCSTAISMLKASSEGASIITKSPEDGEGAVSTVETDSQAKNGFICFIPEKSVVKLKADHWSKEDADTYSADLTSRVRELGKELCLGFMTLGDDIVLESYNEKGQRVGDTAIVTAMETEPVLKRQE